MENAAIQTKTIVGLEIHVQLRTRSKLFCACPVRTDAPPNSCVCPVCLGYPGALPVLNREALRLAILAGMALNGDVARFTKWDRKSYFYPDLPKGYQISQYDKPVSTGGFLEFDVDGAQRHVGIRRAHLEEDAGKNIHEASEETLDDLNRAGTPLLEIVTEPDLCGGEDAYVFCTELQRLIVHLGVSDADMQKGQMRFEPNVNLLIRADGKEYRTPITEVKNLNSFRSVRQAIDFETRRQTAEWEKDHGYVLGRRPNENRGWDAEREVTDFQRGKEAAHDYRYFPDPDLPPVHLDDAMLADVRTFLVELPVARRRRYVEMLRLSHKDADTLVDQRNTAELFESVLSSGGPVEIAGKQFVNVWLKLANARGAAVGQLGVSAAQMAELARITGDGTINKSAANQLAEVLLERGGSPTALAGELGWLQVRDEGATRKWVEEALAENQQAVNDARDNPKKTQAAFGFLRGQVMRISGGKADPRIVGKLLEDRLRELDGG